MVNSSALTNDMRDKRVAVMVFENQTMDPNMDAFGKMISDWITRGLMETGEAKVISAANVQDQIAKASFTPGPNPEFAASTGVEVMLQGRYYLQEDQLLIHANLVATRSGEVLHALEQIQGPKDRMVDLLEELTQEVLGYWITKRNIRFAQNPPKYEAYLKFLEGEQAFYMDMKTSEALLTEAYNMDTTFLAPLIKLIPLYTNNRYNTLADSVIQFIQNQNRSLTKWESLRIDALTASNNFEVLKAARINEEMYRMDASDDNANYNAGSRYTQANYARKAIEIFNELDSIYNDDQGQTSWPEARKALAYNRLGEYENALREVKLYDAKEKYNALAFEHIKALVYLERFDELDKVFGEYLANDVYRQSGALETDEQFYRNL